MAVLGASPGALLVDGRDVNDVVTVGQAQFAGTVRSAASGLVDRGVRPGDTGGVLVPDLVEFALAMHALTAAGAVPLPLLPASAEKLASALGRTRILMVSADLVPLALQIVGLSQVRQVIAFGEVPGTVPFGDLVSAIPRQRPGGLPVHELALRTSSGVLTHAERLASIDDLAGRTGIRNADVVVVSSASCPPELLIGLIDVTLTRGAAIIDVAPEGLPGALTAHRATLVVVGPEELRELVPPIPRQGVSWIAHVVVTGPAPAEPVTALRSRGIQVTEL